jgi:hypothetical protein
MVLDLHDRAIDLVHRGVSAAQIEELDLAAAVRARDRFGPDDADGVRALRQELLAAMEALL